ncbi:hypothetical protein AeRB84_016902 [Aphanomyces euteiches]|nr:hypothetical protein AeRB84_016902 [Aphanomyces euteiches]
MELTMNVIEEGEVDYESTPEDERVALKARKEERVAKERQAAEVQAHKETKQSASEPEPEAKVKIEQVVLPASRDSPVSQQRIWTPLPSAADVYVDDDGKPVKHFAESRFASMAREMHSTEVKFTSDPRWMLNANSDDPASTIVRYPQTQSHPMTVQEHQFVHSQLGIWEEQVNKFKFCQSILYLWDLSQASGCAVAMQSKWKSDQRASSAEGKAWPYVPMATLPGESVEEYLMCFALSYLNPRQTNRLANFAVHRWRMIANAQRGSGFQRLAKSSVANVAVMIRKLSAPVAPYRPLPHAEVDEDGIPIRSENSAGLLGVERKRGRSQAVMDRSLRSRLERPGYVLPSGAAPDAVAVYSYAHVVPSHVARSPSRGRSVDRQSYLRTPPAAAAEPPEVAQVRKDLRLAELELQVRDLTDEIHRLRAEQDGYPSDRKLDEYFDDWQSMKRSVADMQNHIRRLWTWMKSEQAKGRQDQA